MSDDLSALLALTRSLDKSATTIIGAKTELLTNVTDASQQLLDAATTVQKRMAAFTLACEARIVEVTANAAASIRTATDNAATSITKHDAAAVTALGQFNAGRAGLTRDILATVDPALGTIRKELGDQVRRLEQVATDAGSHVAGVDRSVRTTAALGIGLACAAALVAAGISWGSLAWQRDEVTDLKAQQAALTTRIAADTAQVDKLKLRGAELEWNTCKEDRGMLHRDRIHPCIRVDHDLATQDSPMTWSDTNGSYIVPQGY